MRRPPRPRQSDPGAHDTVMNNAMGIIPRPIKNQYSTVLDDDSYGSWSSDRRYDDNKYHSVNNSTCQGLNKYHFSRGYDSVERIPRGGVGYRRAHGRIDYNRDYHYNDRIDGDYIDRRDCYSRGGFEREECDSENSWRFNRRKERPRRRRDSDSWLSYDSSVGKWPSRRQQFPRDFQEVPNKRDNLEYPAYGSDYTSVGTTDSRPQKEDMVLDSKYRRTWKSWSSDSESYYSEERPQYQNARASRDLPSGYLRRNDGVILSEGSSMASGTDTANDRYLDPEIAAQSVVDSLESRGYKYNQIHGVLGSASVSTNNTMSERYTVDLNGWKDNSSEKSMRWQILQRQSNDGSKVAATARWHEKKLFMEKAGGDFQDVNPLGETDPGTPKDWEDPRSTVFRATASQSSSQKSKDSVFRAKVKISDDTQIQSVSSLLFTGADGTNWTNDKVPAHIETSGGNGGGGSDGSPGSAKLVSKGNGKFDTNRLIHDSLKCDSETTGYDESTISTNSQFFKNAGVPMKSPIKSILTDKTISSTPSETLSKGTKEVSSKHVEFSGEFPQMTSAGARVPEIITRSKHDDLRSKISDISSLPNSGQSTMSNLSFQVITENRMERFFEHCFLTCRLNVFQPVGE